MTTGIIENTQDKVSIPILYDSNLERFIFEIFNLKITNDGQYNNFVTNYEIDPSPTLSVLISNRNSDDVDRISFFENRNFSIDIDRFYGYSHQALSSDIDLPETYSDDIKEIIQFGINDFTPPQLEKTLVYDFKFIKSRGDYKFINPNNSETSSTSTRLGTSGTSRGGGY